VAKNYYYPGWWEPGVTMGLLISMEAFNELPTAYQEILKSVCGETFADRLAAYDNANPLALQRLVADHGVTVREYPSDIMDAAWRESNAYLEEQSAADASFRRVYESYKTFRDAQWHYASGNELAYQVSAFHRV
jgi:TRAP-type mannitol/chloroaromatic compound transport system substrate-binding protein